MRYIIDTLKNRDWYTYTDEQQLIVENTVLLVGLLNEMCRIKLFTKSNSDDDIGTVHNNEAYRKIRESQTVLNRVA